MKTLLLLLLAPPCFASHEDLGMGARAAGMGDAYAAVADDLSAMAFNPAALGGIGQPQLSAGFRRGFQQPSRSMSYDRSFWAAGAPITNEALRGVLGVRGMYTNVDDLALDRTVGVTYATRGWREVGSGVLDIGASLNALGRSGKSLAGGVTKAGVDIGALYKVGDEHFFGASVLNLNGPRTDVGGVPDRAPVTAKVGYARGFGGGFAFAVDGTAREPAGASRSAQSGALGIERWLHTVRYGSFASRAGLNLGNRSKSFSIGAGWHTLGAEIDYAAVAPLSGESRWSNAVSLLVRFGAWNSEQEYEKLLGAEIRYRQELTRALDASEARQKQLAEALRRMKSELDKLRGDVSAKTADAEAARAKAQALLERERNAETRLEEIETEKQSIRLKSKQSLLREDWQAYEKLKAQGAPNAVLLERVKLILRQYKDSGADLSEVSQEHLRLLRARPPEQP